MFEQMALAMSIRDYYYVFCEFNIYCFICNVYLKCMEYKVEGTRPRGRPKKTWREIVEKDCRARGLNTEDSMCRSRWRKQIGMIDDHDECSG